MFDIFKDALIDTAKMLPLLLFIYIGIELLEYKMGNKIKDKVKNAGKAGPALGALFGCIPQCGFSVILTALYTKRVITVGTLIAVYLSTSDEAIPVILSQPDKIGLILPLLATKVVIGIIAGYIIDFTLKKSRVRIAESEICTALEEDESRDLDEKGCCGHSCTAQEPDYKELILHPVIHTLKVFAFLFVVSVLINYIIYKIGEENLKSVFLPNSIFQPVIAGLVGLIPNCSASVAITEIFLKGGISFGSTITGLSASAGLGLIVLFKENKNIKDSFKILGILYGISVVAGIAIQYIYG